MRKPLFTGSGVAVITPFTSETVDYAALRRLIDFQLQGGTDAIVVCGTTGEAATMSYVERMRTVETVVRQVDGRVPVIAGTGANSTETAITLSKDAALAGVDGLLILVGLALIYDGASDLVILLQLTHAYPKTKEDVPEIPEEIIEVGGGIVSGAPAESESTGGNAGENKSENGEEARP